MKIKFVRHGETDLNMPVRRMQGVSDYDLNANGVRQAEQTRDALAGENYDVIFSSPLKRAKHTAEIIASVHNAPLLLDERVRERDYGALEGDLFKEEYCALDFDFEKIGGEAYVEYLARLFDFLKEIKQKYDGKNVLVVAHNGVISVLGCLLEGEPADRNYISKGVKNGEVKEFTI